MKKSGYKKTVRKEDYAMLDEECGDIGFDFNILDFARIKNLDIMQAILKACKLRETVCEDGETRIRIFMEMMPERIWERLTATQEFQEIFEEKTLSEINVYGHPKPYEICVRDVATKAKERWMDENGIVKMEEPFTHYYVCPDGTVQWLTDRYIEETPLEELKKHIENNMWFYSEDESWEGKHD